MPKQKKFAIPVKVYKKSGKDWKYWETIKFSDFQYFVENFITGLLEKNYNYKLSEGFYPPGVMNSFISLYNDKEKLMYEFALEARDMKWVAGYIGAWLSSK